MAGGGGGNLVPHQLPDGRVLMVPAHLASAPAGGMADPSGADPMAAAALMQSLQPSPQEQQVASIRSALAPKAPAPPGANEHKSAPTGPGWMPRGEAKSGGGAVDPSTLAEPGGGKAPAPGGEDEGEWNPLVRRVFNEGGGGGGGPRRTGRREETSVTAERLPGKELLPELRWAQGIEERPDLGMELDPDAEQPTWGNADPVMRVRKTGLERGAEAAGRSARLEFEQQLNQEQRRLNAERDVLAQQSQALDDNLSQIAERRTRIAALQETADRRMEEARSFEPRTRKQVWQEMGAAAQVMGVLAMALGGYGVGTGRASRNMGMDAVNKLIDDAVDDDRSKAERRFKVGQAAKSDYEKAFALYGDPIAATLDAKNRKLASAMGMLQNQLAGKGLDEMAKQRGEQLYAAAQQQYLQNAQQLYDQLNGVVVKESINYKPEMAGGGGGGMSTLKRLKNAADATTYMNTIEGKGSTNPHQRSVEGDKLTELNKSFEAIESAEGVQADLKALGAESSDWDDPTSGPIDTVAAALGTGGTARRARQSLERNTENLARGIQIGASDNDAISADKRARADGSGAGRWATAEAAKQKATARIQSTLAGMSPAMRQAYLEGLPPERRAFVQRLSEASTVRQRAASEKAVP